MSLTTENFYDPEHKIWSGPKTERRYAPDITIGEVILEVLNRDPEKVMQISDTTGEKKTAAQLLRESKLIAQHLLNLGLKPGDIVGLYANNTPNLTAVIIATLLCGTPYNCAFWEFDKENVSIVFGITRPKVIFCEIGNYQTLKNALEDMQLDARIIILNGMLPGVESVHEILKDDQQNLDDLRFPCVELNGETTAIILCSSGTTGGPKGVPSSHSRLLELPAFLNVTPDAVICSFSTLFWISGTFTVLTSLVNGALRIVTEKPYSPEYLFYLTEKYGITHLLMGTGPLGRIVNYAHPDTAKFLRTVKVLMTAGSKLHNTVVQKFLHMINNEPKLINAYGLSESSTMVAETVLDTETPRYDCEGKLMPNLEAKILDRTTGVALGPNEHGMLHIRSPFKWAGYYRNEEATKKVYSNDGWLNTSDIAFFDNDGFLFICARDSDIFKSSGFFIFPNKLENLILQLPGVAEACVFAKPHPIADFLATCAIVRTDDEAGRLLTENNVLEHVKRHVHELYQIKGGVYFVGKLPRTASGKIQRRRVFDLIQSGSL